MKSNGGVLSRRRGRAPADHHRALRPGRRRAGRGAWSPSAAGFDAVLDARRRRHLDRRHRGARRTSRRSPPRARVGAYPMQDPDDRRRHGRRRRRLDRVDQPGGHAQGRPAVGGRRPGPALLRRAAAPSRRSPTRTWCSAGSRRTCSAGRSRSTSPPPATGSRSSPTSSVSSLERCAIGVLEIRAWNQANAVRQVTVQRGLDVRDFTLVTFGGSGSLLACRLIDILGLRGVLVPPNPGNALRVRAAHRRRPQRPRAHRGRPQVPARPRPRSRASSRRSTAEADAALDRGGRSRPPTTALPAQRRPALLRPGLRGPGRRAGRAPSTSRRRRRRVPRRARARSTATTSAATDARQVEWVNLRVTGIGPIRRPDDRRASPQGDGAATGPHRRPRPVFFDGWRRHRRSTTAPDSAPGDVVAGPAVIEEFGSTVPVAPRLPAPRSTRSATCCDSRAAMTDPRTPCSSRSSQGYARLGRARGGDRDRPHRRARR